MYWIILAALVTGLHVYYALIAIHALIHVHEMIYQALFFSLIIA